MAQMMAHLSEMSETVRDLAAYKGTSVQQAWATKPVFNRPFIARQHELNVKWLSEIQRMSSLVDSDHDNATLVLQSLETIIRKRNGLNQTCRQVSVRTKDMSR